MCNITTGTYQSKLVLPAVYSGTELDFKKPNQNRWTYVVPPPTWKDRTDFPCHKMTALQIHSIVAFCKYSNWQWIIKDKAQKNHRLFECHKAFYAKSRKQVKSSLETNAAAGSKKPEALDSLIPRLKSKHLPPEEFWYIIKNKVHMDPRGK